MDFRLLGSLEVRANGEQLPLGGPKQRALLALLLLDANRTVSRDRLIDELWGAQPPPSASHTLDAYISRLRKALTIDGNGGAPLVTRAPGYLLRVGPRELDVDRFEALAADGRRALEAGEARLAVKRLREADELWRGRPLADLEFEPFARAHVERLDELRMGALEDRIEAELVLGRQASAVGELKALVADHPLRERLRAHLMVALYREGRQADALDVAREGRVLLRETLGLEPSAQLRELEQAILRQDDTLDPPVTPRSTDASVGRATTARIGRRRLALATSAVLTAALVLAVMKLAGGRDEQRPSVDGNGVAILDLGTGRPSAAIALPSRPAAAVASAGSIWVTAPDTGTVARIDPGGRAIHQTVTVGGSPTGLAVGAGAVWVTSYLDSTVARIDVATQRVVQKTRVRGGPSAIAIGGGRVWAANTAGSTLTRLSADTGAVVDTVHVPVPPSALALSADAMWVASESTNQLLRLRPADGRVLQTIPVGTGPTAISAGRHGIWVANRLDGTISRIDPQRHVVTDTIPVGAGPSDIALAGRSLWVTNELGGTVTEVDAESRRPVRTIRLDGRPRALAAAGGSLFVAVSAPRAAHRGGTLVLYKQEPEFDSLDPATLISISPAQLLGLTNDGLVTLNRVGGSLGLQVVPDLATSLPTPTDGGTTYRFQLRPGIRYSTGRPVNARDLRYAIERMFRLNSTAAPFYRGIVGGAACERHPRHCRLPKGIITDETARTVTFRLAAPDPDFLQKLALPYTAAVPAGTAEQEAIRSPLPATGPYMIASYRPGHDLRLVRNPHFREWSSAAQPDGYPDEIVWRLGVELDDALTAIERGSADWVHNYGPLPPNRRREILTRYASQVHMNLAPFTYYYFLNTRIPPFNDIRVRRALNYAVDRTRLARIYDGRSTCQVLPPQLPGYSPYCPYTRDPDRRGAWNGPDLARARTLIAASRTGGMRIKVVDDRRSGDLEFVVDLLRRLGYRASARIVPGRRYPPTISDSRNRIQIGDGGWGADYAAASNFFDAKFSCRAYRPANRFNNNDSQFCNHKIEALADRARRLGVTDPHAATRLWARVYRAIVDEAPWMPTVTPRQVDFLSKRVGNYQFHPLWGMLAAQLWVR